MPPDCVAGPTYPSSGQSTRDGYRQIVEAIQMWRKRLKAASLEPCRVIVDLIDDVLGGLGKRLFGIVGDDQEPKAACETKVICRPAFLDRKSVV